MDHNCNGIAGIDPTTKKDYEDELCSGTQQYGYILLGDSAGILISFFFFVMYIMCNGCFFLGAHFHIPPQWITASQINNETFTNLIEILEVCCLLPH